ncbi:MAG: cysteine synthase A [Clostridia bacterium]|nr:cysteine synthase A [Clostridia bacterium]
MIYNSVAELIGRTPIIRLHNIEKAYGVKAQILAKLEYFNPAGSAKDRVAKAMICAAEEKGILKNGGTIVEPTSGNTGIGLASVGTSLGYKVILTMPDTMSVERINLLKAYGATIVLTEGALGMQGAIDKAKEILESTENSFMPGQFDNPENPKSHYETTGPEIFADLGGKVDIFVAGVGTGGTLSGVGAYLKENIEGVKVVAVEPSDSPLLEGGKAAPHKLQGIGANFIPENLDRNIYDYVLGIATKEAYEAGNAMAKKEGILVGISSGAALFAAITLGRMPENENKRIVVLLPDGGERYLSTPMFD